MYGYPLALRSMSERRSHGEARQRRWACGALVYLPFLHQHTKSVGGHVHAVEVCQTVTTLDIFADESKFAMAVFIVKFVQVTQRSFEHSTFQSVGSDL